MTAKKANTFYFTSSQIMNNLISNRMFATRTVAMRLYGQIDFPIDFIKKSSSTPESLLQNSQNVSGNLCRKLFSEFRDLPKLFPWHLIIAVVNKARIIIKKEINVI